MFKEIGKYIMGDIIRNVLCSSFTILRAVFTEN